MPKEYGFTQESPYFQPLSDAVCAEVIPKNLKPPPLSVFDGMTDDEQHIRAIDYQATTLRATNTLKYVLMLGTFKGKVLDWYMGLPKASISGYPILIWEIF